MFLNGKGLEALFAIYIVIVQISCEIVTIEDGQIEGTEMTSRMNRNFHAFLRIPFAEPPLGDLRFRAPRPNKPWNGTLDATKYGPICMQKAYVGSFLSEDCLQLNVFTRELPSIGAYLLKPVIVYIHGGGFERGSAIQQGPHYLMDRDIVLVTINYRLGAFGFLATGTADAVGNAALKDQTLALQWVQKNIIKFGGNPLSVTLSGLSVGAHSATAQMISPMARGLFHKVIAMSGAITWFKPLRKEHLKEARQLAANVNCFYEDESTLINCLKNKSAVEIAEVEMNAVPECPILVWLPVVEPDFGQQRFFTEQPINSVRSQNFSMIPIITGITADEFISPVPQILQNPELLNKFNENFQEIAPYCLAYDENDQQSASIKRKYFPFDQIDARSFDNLNQLFSDALIGYSVYNFVQLISNITDVFYYRFSYIGRHSIFMHPSERQVYGVHHVDDLQYVIYVEFLAPYITSNDSESFMVERMTRIWEKFAWTGNPNDVSDNYLREMNWIRHDTMNEYYLDIGRQFVEKNGLYLRRYKFWDGLSAGTPPTSMYSMIVLVLSLSISLKVISSSCYLHFT